jgi:hypothetical protein
LGLYGSAGVSALCYLKQVALDTNQGALSYSTNNFVDDGQVFTTWATSGGNAAYIIVITQDDASIRWGYLGATVNATTIKSYTTIQCDTAGFNGASAGTPSAYEIRTAGYDTNPYAFGGKGILVGALPVGATAVELDFYGHPSEGFKADADLVIDTLGAANLTELALVVDWTTA